MEGEVIGLPGPPGPRPSPGSLGTTRFVLNGSRQPVSKPQTPFSNGCWQAKAMPWLPKWCWSEVRNWWEAGAISCAFSMGLQTTHAQTTMHNIHIVDDKRPEIKLWSNPLWAFLAWSQRIGTAVSADSSGSTFCPMSQHLKKTQLEPGLPGFSHSWWSWGFVFGFNGIIVIVEDIYWVQSILTILYNTLQYVMILMRMCLKAVCIPSKWWLVLNQWTNPIGWLVDGQGWNDSCHRDWHWN